MRIKGLCKCEFCLTNFTKPLRYAIIKHTKKLKDKLFFDCIVFALQRKVTKQQ
jgi:hypothetical protein